MKENLKYILAVPFAILVVAVMFVTLSGCYSDKEKPYTVHQSLSVVSDFDRDILYLRQVEKKINAAKSGDSSASTYDMPKLHSFCVRTVISYKEAYVEYHSEVYADKIEDVKALRCTEYEKAVKVADMMNQFDTEKPCE